MIHWTVPFSRGAKRLILLGEVVLATGRVDTQSIDRSVS
jgi:hypothetical protein